MYAPYQTDPSVVDAAKAASAIIAAALKKPKKRLITREDDWSLSRAKAALDEILAVPVNHAAPINQI